MFDDIAGALQVFDFEEFANHLLEQGLQCSPSEIHGGLCGLLSAGAALEPELGLAALCQFLEVDLYGELAEQTMQLYTVSAQALLDEEFQFHPLLPEDDADIAERTAAVALWCKGYLSGFAHHTAQADHPSQSDLSADSKEILVDIAAIAEADNDDEATEEESEDSYFEIVEYLRFAVLNVFMDTLAISELEAPGDDVLH